MNTSELNSFIVILIYGSLVLLSLLKLTNPLRVNRKANFWFGIFLFLWSTFWMDEVLFLITGETVEFHSLFPLLLFFISVYCFIPTLPLDSKRPTSGFYCFLRRSLSASYW